MLCFRPHCWLLLLVPAVAAFAQKDVEPDENGLTVIRSSQVSGGTQVQQLDAESFRPAAADNPAAAQAAAELAKKQAAADTAKAAQAAKAAGNSNGKDKGTGQPGKPTSPTSGARVKRPESPDAPPDPAELLQRPDAAGRVQFNFHGQPWPDVVQWLADVSALSLDWQDLPGDYLNLTTQRSYTLPEARDIINQHLLARGYTMLLDGETLRVVEIKKLNKAMIPRVAPADLVSRQPHEFVRTSFRLEWLVAADAVTELKPMLSEHGNLYQLASTNRLEAVDTVGNLRAIHELLQEEQSDQGEEGLVRHFKIRHRRAADVMALVQQLMGINPDNPAQPLSSAQMKQIQKAIATAQKSAAGQVARTPIPTTLVLNQRENSILATAEPDKLKQIEQAIKELDVPTPAEEALLGNMNRMKIYRLNTYDPEPLVKLLVDLGQLDPRTKLEADKANRSIMAYASLADHLLISTLIEKVDGSTRKFEVIQLQKLDAESVTGTIRFMMGEDQEQGRNDWDYYYYRRRSGSGEDSEKFRVDADVENNRLLLRANETELVEIRNLLRKLGEDPDRIITSESDLIRVYDVPGRSSAEILERLRKLWHLDNPLEIDAQSPGAVRLPAAPTTQLEMRPGYRRTVAQVASSAATGQEETDDAAADFFRRIRRAEAEAAGNVTPAGEDATATGDRQLPPVRISVRDGRIIVTSNDAQALAAAEKLLQGLVPRTETRAYKIFTVQYVSPGWMALTLEDFFDIDSSPDYFWGPPKEDKASLSKKKDMRFITDSFTKTLMVLNADDSQLATIQTLIDRFDVPISTESRQVRVTKLFEIRHSQAAVIAESIKEVYRDLLSGNDKALQKENAEDKNGSGSSTPFSFFGSATYLTDDEDEKVKFNGYLSIGVDPISNTLIVSGTEALVENIGEMINKLDIAAQPASNMRVVPVSKNINLRLLQQRLERLVTRPQPANPQQHQQQQQMQKMMNGQGAQLQFNNRVPQGSQSRRKSR